MKKKSLASIILFMCVFMFCMPVYAGKAVNVTMKSKGSPYVFQQYYILYGRDLSGKTVWKYKTSKQPFTELNSANYVVKGKSVFLIDNDTYIRIRKSDGKVLVKKKLPSAIWGAKLKVDSSNYLYAIGYYGSTLYKISSKGIIKWSHTFVSDYYWPYKISIMKNTVTVYFEGERKGKNKTGKCSVNKTTGK